MAHREGSTLILRDLTNLEIALVRRWLEDPNTAHFLNKEEPVFEDPGYQPPCQKWLKTQLEAAKASGGAPIIFGESSTAAPYEAASATSAKVVFAIARKADDELLGMIVLKVSMLHQVGTLRIVIAPEFRGRHIGREAERLVLDYAFTHLGLEKVCTEMLAHNYSSFRVSSVCGFRLEGVLRNHALVDGERYDLLCMGILRDEFLGEHRLHA